MARASSRDLLRSASRLAIAAATATLLTGCGGFSSLTGSGDATDGQMASSPSELIQPEERDFIGGAAYWGAKFEANHNDVDAALSFARNLRLMGGARQAVTVMKDIVMTRPDDARVLSEYGKALTASGRAADAVPFLARAAQINDNDWSTLSAYGVALDQVGSHGPARDNYEAALRLSPGNPVVQSNLALSDLLDGRIAEAEPILRQLVARPNATPQMRQNLAMVESIRGNKAEAEQLVRSDLPKSDADNNISVLNQLSASNASVDVQPLAAPGVASAAAAKPEAAALAQATSADSEAPVATSAGAPTPAPVKPAARQIVTMAPIADDDAPAKPAHAIPATASIGTTPAATPNITAPATAAATAASATPAAPADSSTAAPPATAQPTPTSAAPDGSQTSLRSSQATDPFRPKHEVNVANAAP